MEVESPPQPGERTGADPREPAERLLRDLRADRRGLSQREAQRRLITSGANELRRSRARTWPAELGRQFVHPLALLLAAAAALSWIAGSHAVAIAIVAVILINAFFAFAQEQQAERAVELLGTYLPPHASVLRDGEPRVVAARELVPGDVLLVSEGDRISADARLLEGALEVDTSTLTGESLPVYRSAELTDVDLPFLQARDLVFSGTTCTGGEARALVFATGMRSELGRIAALSERVKADESPLESQVRRVAWIIAAIAVSIGVAFLPLGMLVAGLPFASASAFAIGLLAGNVPEGLLPTITLALAMGVRLLAGRGALVKRLSAVETLGSASVICTDKTGTLTENRMRVVRLWADGEEYGTEEHDIEAREPVAAATASVASPWSALLETIVACNTARVSEDDAGTIGDPTEIALLIVAMHAGVDVDGEHRVNSRRRLFHFDPALKLMSTVDDAADAPGGLVVHTKGAPEVVVARCTRVLGGDESERVLTNADRAKIDAVVTDYARDGLRVLAVARRLLDSGDVPARREWVERDLCFVGLVAMFDPPRAEVAAAVARCHEAGIRIIVVTGDHGLTAAEIARRVGIGARRVVTGAQLESMSEADLDGLLATGEEIVFARNSPEAKLRIADALRAQGEVVAMTGDGVNDAPALRRADIGIAMGRSGTDVARDAATMILTDDNFASIATAVEEGRRVYANVRKFIFYIFVHATPEVVPFLVFALAGGAVPLPLTVLGILAIDLGTETLPALALGREPAEPGLMQQRPRARAEGVIQRPMLVRAWFFLGLISAALAMAGFFLVLLEGGWHAAADVGAGHALHETYLQATTMTFLGIVACQVGTAFAARTDRASLRSVGLTTNPLLLWGVAFELAFAAAVAYLPPFQAVFQTAAPPLHLVALLPLFPVVVWGADELHRAWLRRRDDPSPGHSARGAVGLAPVAHGGAAR